MMTSATTRKRRWARRRGVTATEMALVIMLFLTFVFGMLDLGILLTRSHSLTQAARCGARAAIVRGEFADVLSPLGPTDYSGMASDTHPIADAVRGHLVAMNPGSVRLNVSWPDANNAVESRVRVAVAADFTPLMTFIFGAPTWTLTGASEMPIAH